MLPGRLTRLASTELALTNTRVIGKVGMFWRKTMAVPHKNIELVVAQRGLFGLMFNYGAITVTSKEGNRITFKGIADPQGIAQQIETASELATLGRSLPKRAEAEAPVPITEPARLPPAAEEKPPAPVPHLPKDPNAW